MKKKLFGIVLGGMLFSPMCVTALTFTDGNGNDDGSIPNFPRSPAHNPSAYITYFDMTGVALVSFVSSVDNAEIIVMKDGMVVANQGCQATAGMQIPIYLPAYGSGEFCIEVRSGNTLIAYFNVTL
jgi:hypothetical protein